MVDFEYPFFRIAQNKKIRDVVDLRDESSRGKIRIVLELRRGASSKFVINSLYKYTRLQDSFSVNFLALVNGQPKILNLKKLLHTPTGVCLKLKRCFY